MQKRIGMIMAATLGLLAATAQAAFDITTKDASGGDASLHENLPDAVNNDSTVTVRSRLVAGSARHSAAVFRFGVASLNDPATSATLKFDVTAADGDSFAIDVFGLVDGTTKGSFTDADWPEAGVAYNTIPGFSGSNYPNIDRNHVPGETLLLGTINYAAGTTGEISMASTTALVDFINRIDKKFFSGDSFTNILAQHKMLDIG